MVAVKITAFGGMIPAQDDKLLPQNNASLAQNCFLDGGTLRGLNDPVLLHTMSNPGYKYAYRIPLAGNDKNHLASSYWLEFADPDTNVLQSPVSDDAYSRFYFASASSIPQYNTKSRILNGSAPFTLGIPTPETAPTVTPGSTAPTTETRSYVYTWISAYGEEGPPSPPTNATGTTTAAWTVGLTPPLAGDTANRNLQTVRIYRTVTDANGNATFYQIADLPIATTSYNDTMLDADVSSRAVLSSTTYTPPPSDLQGWVLMPNGMIAGWRANEVWFCEPYLPHAWPANYTLSVAANVVGLGVVGQTLVILTDGYPYSATGVSPATMAQSKLQALEPCMSRASIVSTETGVLYASPNGLCLAAYGLVQNATQQMATKDRYLDLVAPETLRAARLGASYYSWGSPVFGSFDSGSFDNASFVQYDYEYAFDGALINLADPRIGWITLSSGNTVTDNVMVDIWSGELFIMRNGQVLWLDLSSNEIAGPYLWTSKEFQLTERKNIAAFKVWFDPTVNDPNFTLAGNRNTDLVQTLQPNQYGLVRVFADGNLVVTRELRTSGELMRVPAGFKAEYWQFQIEARVKVSSIEAASSVRELAQI
jgi:hypothetical protein